MVRTEHLKTIEWQMNALLVFYSRWTLFLPIRDLHTDILRIIIR